MKAAIVLLAVIGVACLAVIAWILAAEEFTRPTMSDGDLVWCDANRALLGLSAETLGLLPEDLVDLPLNVTSDDSDEDLSDLSELSALTALRYLRAVSQEAPPQQFADIGFPTEPGFERFAVLAPRALSGAALIVGEWIGQLDGGWDHPDVSRACTAAAEAFR